MITIRQVNKDEISDIQALNDEVFIDNSKYDPDLDLSWAKGEKGRKYFIELLNDPESLCLIVEDGNRKVGYLAVGPKHIEYRLSRYCEIQNMGVIPEYRSQGIGKVLMDECFSWARAQGYQKVFVNSYIKNQGALDFYKENEFEEIDISLEKSVLSF